MKIKNFEDIMAWKKARKIVNKIYNITDDRSWEHDYALKDQIERASISIMSNIAEGFERETTKEFIRFLYMSRGSVGEVKSLIYILLDRNIIKGNSFKELHNELSEIGKILNGFIAYLKNRNS